MRKGQLTIPNMAGVAVLLFIFGVLSKPIVTILADAAGVSGPMLSAVLKSLPMVFVLGLFVLPWAKAEKKRLRRRGGGRGR